MADKPSEKNGKFDTGLIRELAAILREADLGEIEIEQSGMRIKVVKASRPCTSRRPRSRARCCRRRLPRPPQRAAPAAGLAARSSGRREVAHGRHGLPAGRRRRSRNS